MNQVIVTGIILINQCIVDFILVALTEYLDTHPDDTVAISYFNHYSKIKTKMCMEFSQKYYPLMKDYADSSKRFRWLDAPMCYEGGC